MEGIEIIIENPEQGIANYEPLKAWAMEQAAVYGNLLVSQDAIKDAKSDCAMLRKMANSASDLRIRIQKEHAAKIATVTGQLQEVTCIFNDAAKKIADQVADYEEQRRRERIQEIKQIYAEEIGDMADLIPLRALQSPEWLNKGTNIKTIRADIQVSVVNARKAIEQIRALRSPHENAMIEAYLERMNIVDALAAKNRLDEIDAAMARRRAEEEARKAREAEERKKAEEQRAQEPVPAPTQKKLTVIEFAEQRLQEETRQNDLGADNGHLLAYWAAYLDGARAQEKQDKNAMINAYWAAYIDGARAQKKEGGELAMSALNYVERHGFMAGMDYAGMTADERETLLKELRNLPVGPVAPLVVEHDYAKPVKALQAEVKRLQDKLCDWCAVCPKERRNPEDCEMLSETPVMYVPSDAKMEVQDG